MEIIQFFVDVALHLDKNLIIIIDKFGVFTYLVLFLVIFAETGFVVTPFLPGDSLLFAAGTFSTKEVLNPFILFFLLSLAAILGDSVNYWVGSFVGPKAFKSENARFFKKRYLEKTSQFYEKHGGKTIVLARFIPIIRTFAPFVAGIAKMNYFRFLAYNIVGGVIWVGFFVFLGNKFGNLAVVRDNFSLTILAIIFISILPGVIEFINQRLNSSKVKSKKELV
jgi:membrane-associated protein